MSAWLIVTFALNLIKKPYTLNLANKIENAGIVLCLVLIFPLYSKKMGNKKFGFLTLLDPNIESVFLILALGISAHLVFLLRKSYEANFTSDPCIEELRTKLRRDAPDSPANLELVAPAQHDSTMKEFVLENSMAESSQMDPKNEKRLIRLVSLDVPEPPSQNPLDQSTTPQEMEHHHLHKGILNALSQKSRDLTHYTFKDEENKE